MCPGALTIGAAVSERLQSSGTSKASLDGRPLTRLPSYKEQMLVLVLKFPKLNSKNGFGLI